MVADYSKTNVVVRCPICDSKEVTRFRRNRIFTTYMFSCHKCDLFFSSPQVTVQSIAHRYSAGTKETWIQKNVLRKIISKTSSYDTKRRYTQLAAMIDDKIGNNSNVLEVGKSCYTDRVDVIVLEHVLEHIPNPVDFLYQISSLMTENGLLFLEIPNSKNYYQIHDMGRNDEHLFWYEPQNLGMLLIKCGFVDIDAITYDCGDIQVDWVINKLLFNKKSKTYTGHHSIKVGNELVRMWLFPL